jgi:hypothetical protein
VIGAGLGRERGLDEGGCHRHDADAVRREFQRHRLGHAVDHVLGAATDGLVAPADHTHLRGDIDEHGALLGRNQSLRTAWEAVAQWAFGMCRSRDGDRT